MVQRLKLSIALEKNEAFEPPGQPGVYLIGCVLACSDAENIVELFESALPEKNVSGSSSNEKERTNFVSGTMKKMTTKMNRLSPA